MLIALFAPYDLSRPGGVGTHIRAQARALGSLGHDVRIYGPSSAPLADGETRLGGVFPITITGTESWIGLDPRSAIEAARVLRRTAFDIVHVHEPLTPLAPWAAVMRSRAPVVGTFHVCREEGHRVYAAARPLLAPLAARIACRIAVSKSARDTAARYFPGEYEVVPNGIDVPFLEAPRARPSRMRAGGAHVLFVGRLEPRKGVDVLIRAMAAVQIGQPRARLVVVGDGPDRRALEALASSEQVDVDFTGYVPDDDVPAYLQACDVLCAPSTGGESFGIVLLEALACGTPIVASRIDGYTDLIGGAGCGPLVPPKDPEALAAALTSLLADRAHRVELGGRGRTVAQQYDWSAIARLLEGIYARLTAPDAVYH